MNLAWTVERDSGVSLVRCRVHNESAVPRRVRIESQLDGPVLPPRRAGIPETGWDEAGVTFRLEPDERRALGFAALAEPVEPPVEVVRSSVVDADGAHAKSGSEAIGSESERHDQTAESVEDAIRTLAEHRPPRGAVAAETATDATGTEETGTDATGTDATGTEETEESEPEEKRGCDNSGGTDSRSHDPRAVDSNHDPSRDDPIDEWFTAVSHRIERAERMTDADLSTATDIVESAGGVSEVTALDERVTADSERLREISERASALATRAEAVDTPVEALERLS